MLITGDSKRNLRSKDDLSIKKQLVFSKDRTIKFSLKGLSPLAKHSESKKSKVFE